MKELIQYGLELGKYKLLWELLKAKDIRYERQIAGEVQEFLDRNYKAIIAMRTIDQCRDGQFKLGEEQIRALEQRVENVSGGVLKHWEGSLCLITNRWIEWQHERVYFGNDLKDNVAAVKGHAFSFIEEEKIVNCVVLDGGNSRKYFDEMGRREKREFVRRVGYLSRLKNLDISVDDVFFFLDYESEPVGFTVFLTDTGKELIIDEIVSIRRLDLSL